MRLARLVLAASALPFLGIGGAFLLWPARLGARVGLEVASATADNDVRAVYGGLQLACGVFLAVCAARPTWTQAGVAAQLLLYAGLATARVVSWGARGLPDPLALGLHAAELAGLLLGVVAWRSLARGGSAAGGTTR